MFSYQCPNSSACTFDILAWMRFKYFQGPAFKIWDNDQVQEKRMFSCNKWDPNTFGQNIRALPSCNSANSLKVFALGWKRFLLDIFQALACIALWVTMIRWQSGLIFFWSIWLDWMALQVFFWGTLPSAIFYKCTICTICTINHPLLHKNQERWP